MPAVREGENIIEIDQKRGQWPYMKVVKLEDGDLAVFMDCNPGGQVIGTGAGLSAITLSPKKARRLREFLERVEG